jgi:polyferredoxin
VVYAGILLVVASAFVTILVTASEADVTLLRGRGLPFSTLPSGEISNQLRVKIVNRSAHEKQYTLSVAGAEGVTIAASENPMRVGAGEFRTEPVQINAPVGVFKGGRCEVLVRVSDSSAFAEELKYRLLGPFTAGGRR